MSELCEPNYVAGINDLIKVLRSANERLPLVMSADLTYRCNFLCPHCFCRIPQDASTSRRELSWVEWDRILGEAADEGVLFVTFTGGEPLLRDDFCKLWTMAKRRGFIIELFTNGSLITPDLANFFAELTPKQISVTVYAATEETYRRISGVPGMHSRVLHALDLLVDRGVPVEVKALFSRLSVHEFEALRKQASHYDDLFRWQVELIGCYACSGGNPDAVQLSPEEIVTLELADPVRSGEWRQRLAHWKPAVPHPDTPFRCQIGIGRFHVAPYGGMRPCMLLESCSYDLRTGSVKEGWRKAIPEALAAFHTAPGPCQTCELAEICRICPAYALLSGYPPAGPSPFYCSLARERAKAYGLDTKTPI